MLVVQNLPASAGDIKDVGLIPGSGRSLGGGHGNPLQYSCLENPHGQRSLAGYSPWSHKELDMTEQLSTAQIENIFENNYISLELAILLNTHKLFYLY